jgi:hypothetical protein
MKEMVQDIRERYLDKKFRDNSWSVVASAPVSAINGVSEEDGVYLQRAFNIKTIQDLAENKFVRVAQTIISLAEIARARE